MTCCGDVLRGCDFLNPQRTRGACRDRERAIARVCKASGMVLVWVRVAERDGGREEDREREKEGG